METTSRRPPDRNGLELPAGEARIPLATYRLQFNRGFRFSDARKIVAYLHQLGISDIYASPCFKARPGSLHGYDILDPNVLNPELGSETDFEDLVDELRRLGMGLLLDVVPNHMCIEGSGNAWWMDLLENGVGARHGNFFDIDWEPAKRELKNKVLYPILGDQYGAVLENGELILGFDEGAFFLSYYDHRLPILPKSYGAILTHRLADLEQMLGADHPHLQELLSIDTALRNLPPPTECDPELINERYREKEIAKRRLWTLYQQSPEIRGFIDRNLGHFNGERGNASSFDLLDRLLRSQVFRLSHWRVATEEINYRRFFDINALASIRMEDPQVFAEGHRLILRLVREGKVTGLRVDHLDGLYDPVDYLEKLQCNCFVQQGMGSLARPGEEIPGEEEERKWEERLQNIYAERRLKNPGCLPFFVVGEKILMKGETLQEDWPIFGTTGYEFANQVNGLFVETANGRLFDALYARFIGLRRSFPEIVYETKKLVMQATMSGEVNALGYRLNAISEVNRHTRDFTLNSLTRALVEVIAFFPVYRTYAHGGRMVEQDRRYVEYAVGRAKRRNPATDPSVFDFVKRVLLLGAEAGAAVAERDLWLDLVMRFQQLTGPVMAKGVEDTAFYVYNRLISLNEVGGSPERFGTPLEAFHGQNIERNRSRFTSLLAISTHDTKRSEDVRARINVLSEIPEQWRAAVGRWRRFNRKRKDLVDGQAVPDRNEEYLLYQTLVGAWPIEPAGEDGWESFRRRIGEYLLKAVREAKVNSSWIRPNTNYEEALVRFVDRLLQDGPRNRFLADLRQFQQLTSHCGMLNSLSQTLLKMTVPGIPDFYQGCELWDFSLVDPDNRRPVDYRLRRRAMEEIRQGEAAGLLPLARLLAADMTDGRIKLFVICRTLGLRQRQRDLFRQGSYLPLEVRGARAHHVCAFARNWEEKLAVIVTPRFFTRLVGQAGALPLGEETWLDTRILLPSMDADCSFGHQFTGEIFYPRRSEEGEVLFLRELLEVFPTALLEALPGG